MMNNTNTTGGVFCVPNATDGHANISTILGTDAVAVIGISVASAILLAFAALCISAGWIYLKCINKFRTNNDNIKTGLEQVPVRVSTGESTSPQTLPKRPQGETQPINIRRLQRDEGLGTKRRPSGGGETVQIRRGETVQMRGGERVQIRGEAVQIRGGEAVQIRGGEAVQIRGGEPVQIRGGETVQIRGGETVQIRGGEPVQIRGGEPVQIRGGEPVQIRGGETVQIRGGEPVQIRGGETVQIREAQSVLVPMDSHLTTFEADDLFEEYMRNRQMENRDESGNIVAGELAVKSMANKVKTENPTTGLSSHIDAEQQFLAEGKYGGAVFYMPEVEDELSVLNKETNEMSCGITPRYTNKAYEYQPSMIPFESGGQRGAFGGTDFTEKGQTQPLFKLENDEDEKTPLRDSHASTRPRRVRVYERLTRQQAVDQEQPDDWLNNPKSRMHEQSIQDSDFDQWHNAQIREIENIGLFNTQRPWHESERDSVQNNAQIREIENIGVYKTQRPWYKSEHDSEQTWPAQPASLSQDAEMFGSQDAGHVFDEPQDAQKLYSRSIRLQTFDDKDCKELFGRLKELQSECEETQFQTK